MEIIVASHNPHKIREIDNVLSALFSELKLLTPSDVGVTDEVEETGSSFEENAMLKARSVWKHGKLAIADDSGLCVNALSGAPGIYSARYAGEPSSDEKNNAKLLSELSHHPDRSAYFVCVIACILPSGDSFTVKGKAPGSILTSPAGNGGFGYDPLFLSDDVGKSFAELTPEEKNSISHRGRALRALKEKLEKVLCSD